MKTYQNFSSESFHFLVIKFSIYLNRRFFCNVVWVSFGLALGPFLFTRYLRSAELNYAKTIYCIFYPLIIFCIFILLNNIQSQPMFFPHLKTHLKNKNSAKGYVVPARDNKLTQIYKVGKNSEI